MHVIVPLAGPDFVRTDGTIKALTSFRGQPLLKHSLDSRPWASKATRYSFVLYDCEATRRFAHDYLKVWYQGSSFVYISTFTRGAALSALAGLSLLDSFCQPLVIDLADIIYTSVVDIEGILQKSQNVGGIALVFDSANPQYSYLASDSNGQFFEAAEKKLISRHASTGTYIFRDCPTFLRSIAHAIENEASQTHNNLFYVCPLFNGVLAQGKQVILDFAFDIMDAKIVCDSHS
jgi:hypothetical protein